MPILYCVTHSQVQVDASVPVPVWGLSDIRRARDCNARSADPAYRQVNANAMETAEILAAHLNLAIEGRERMHENDRSATGFLPLPEFDQRAYA